MIKFAIFEGGENVGDDNIDFMDEWSEDSIKSEFISYFGDEWAEEETDMFEGGDVKMLDTVHVINDRMAQCVTDGCDGGMTYLVRL
jgi:hypothetical protein